MLEKVKMDSSKTTMDKERLIPYFLRLIKNTRLKYNRRHRPAQEGEGVQDEERELVINAIGKNINNTEAKLSECKANSKISLGEKIKTITYFNAKRRQLKTEYRQWTEDNRHGDLQMGNKASEKDREELRLKMRQLEGKLENVKKDDSKTKTDKEKLTVYFLRVIKKLRNKYENLKG